MAEDYPKHQPMENRKNSEWVFIINPAAGGGHAGAMKPRIEEMIQKYKVDASVIMAEKMGDVARLALQYAGDGSKYIIGVGGDGTFNELASALLDEEGVTLGLIPAGTGNDFIQILGFPDHFEEEHWKTLFGKKSIRMDVGMSNSMPFFNGMGLGFDAQVAAENYTAPGEVKKGGKNKYLFHIIKTILFYTEKRMSVISAETKQDTDCFINTISIGRRFAGSFFLTPKAIANDGLLDVCMIKKLSIPERFGILPKVPKGAHLQNKKVHYYQTSKIELDFGKKVPFHLDGELHFAGRFEVSILPSAINVLYNPTGNHFFKID